MSAVTLVTPFAVVLVGALLRLAQQYVQAKVTPEKLGHITDLARMAVRAAEQVGADSKMPPPPVVSTGTEPSPTTGVLPEPDPVTLTGADKYQLASEALVAGAKRLGVRLKPAEVTSFIHAALKEMNDAALDLAHQS